MEYDTAFFYFKEDFHNNSENYAASKGIYDVDYCLQKILGDHYINNSNVSAIEVEGFSKINKISYYFSGNKLKLLYTLMHTYNKKVFIQYPFYKGKVFDLALKQFMKRNHVILIVHDVDSIRMDDVNEKIELDTLNLAKGLILMQGNCMKTWLLRHGITVKNIITMDIYDYIVPPFAPENRFLGKEIAFAGNLRKSSFLEHIELLKNPFILNLYGPFYEEKKERLSRNICYWGNYSPDIIPRVIKGSFGLIWDGESIETEKGSYGYYNKFNIPFKFPMYIVSGLPVICWSNAGIADYVRKYDLGICVKSLDELSNKIDEISPSRYREMLNNVLALRQRLMTGQIMQQAIKRAMNYYN